MIGVRKVFSATEAKPSVTLTGISTDHQSYERSANPPNTRDMTRYVLIARFAQLSGYTVTAIEGKIHSGVWVEGREYRRAPDGRILVDIEGFEKWVEGQRRAA